MTARSDHPPIRVERALALLPDLDVLAPLRSFVVSLSRGGRLAAEPYRTVGKRTIHSTELRALIPRAVGRLADHLSLLYEAAIEALEAEERGDLSSSVHALLAAGEREEAAGRPEAAGARPLADALGRSRRSAGAGQLGRVRGRGRRAR